VGETVSGVPFEEGLHAVEELRPLAAELGPGASMAQLALRWILMFREVTCAIPGAKTPEQAEANAASAAYPALSEAAMARVRAVYDRHFRASVHGRW